MDCVLFDIGSMSKRMIASVKVQSVPGQDSQVEVQDVPQAKTFHSKGFARRSARMSEAASLKLRPFSRRATPEDLSE